MSDSVNSCGNCTMCCKLMAVEALHKPVNTRCTHCIPGGGCKIYDRRPQECRGYECLWRFSQHDEDTIPMPLEMRPDHSKCVINAQPDGGIGVRVDPGQPFAWQNEPVLHFLRTAASQGMKVRINEVEVTP